MIVLYIAGPYRAANSWEIEQNIRRAEHLSLLVYTLGGGGFVPLCPHTMTRHFQGYLPDAAWLAGDLELLRRCDGVLLVDGWERSAGALAEIALAQKQGIPIFETPSEAWGYFAQGQSDEPPVGEGSSGLA